MAVLQTAALVIHQITEWSFVNISSKHCRFQTIIDRKLTFWYNFTCLISCVTCHMSCVRCHKSQVTCNSPTGISKELTFFENVHPPPYDTYHEPCIRCHVSCETNYLCMTLKELFNFHSGKVMQQVIGGSGINTDTDKFTKQIVLMLSLLYLVTDLTHV